MYTVEIYRQDIANDEIYRVDEITTFQNLFFRNRLNSVGECTFQLNIYDDKATQENLIRFSNIVAVKRNDSIVWVGPIIDIQGFTSDIKGQIVIYCGTWQYFLKNRHTAKLDQFESDEQGDILWQIIDEVQSRTNGEMFITEGAECSTTINRDRTYEYKNVSDLMEQMSAVTNGLDYTFDPSVDANGMLTGVVFNRYYPKKGTLKSDLPVITVDNNVVDVEFKTSKNIYNNGISEGAGTGESVISYEYDNSSSQLGYGRMEKMFPQKDVSIVETLQENLEDYIDQNAVERLQVRATFKGEAHPQYGSYSVGDTIKVKFEVGNYLNYEKDVRVLEIGVQVGSEGEEYITPTFDF